MATNRFPLKAHRFDKNLFRCYLTISGKRKAFYGHSEEEAITKAYAACAEEKNRYDQEHTKDKFLDFIANELPDTYKMLWEEFIKKGCRYG